jgi:hypothetical protein
MRIFPGAVLALTLLALLAFGQDPERPGEGDKKDLETRYREAIARHNFAAHETGFHTMKTGWLSVDVDAVQAFRRAWYERVQKWQYVLEFPEEAYGDPGEEGGHVIFRRDGKVKVAYLHPHRIPPEVTLKRLLEFEQEAMDRMMADLKRLAAR